MSLAHTGVCYYPEHWPREQWPEQAAAMRGWGIRLVRIGEFAWSRIEPEAGRFDWEWLDRALATLVAESLDIILCTPTACPPRWLVDAHPDKDPAGMAAILVAEGERVKQEDVRACRAMGRYGAALLVGPSRVLTHCNAGGLATAGYGTALGVIRAAHEAL